jgi:hypothetical protein
MGKDIGRAVRQPVLHNKAGRFYLAGQFGHRCRNTDEIKKLGGENRMDELQHFLTMFKGEPMAAVTFFADPDYTNHACMRNLFNLGGRNI